MLDIFNVHFAGSHYFFVFPVFALMIFLVLRNYSRIKTTIQALTSKKMLKQTVLYFSLPKQLIKAIMMSAALCFLFIALMQPQWGKKEETIMQEGRDLVILFDVSRSMLAQDIKPNRLEFAKLKVRNLLKELTVERVGLVLFSGSAFIQCPLTADHSAFLMFLDHLDAESISSGTTDIGAALKKALTIFSNSPERKNKLVLLVTDGEDYSANLSAIKNRAAKEDIKLFALGIGTPEGAPVPIIDHFGKHAGFEVDENGKVALTKLNEEKLKEVTQGLSGHYFKSHYQDTDIQALVRLVKSFEKEKFSDKRVSLYEDQYPWFLAVATALLALEWIL